MEPLYTNMQSCAHQNGQMHYRPCCHHGMEARPAMSYECWPWGDNYGYTPTGAYHGCCNHAQMPAHSAWGSPFSHVPPHPGNYPCFPVYMPSMAYNVMEHPRYEYGKNVPMVHHCCGCSNHLLNQKGQRNVEIEEEEPEKERKNHDSLLPSQKNHESLVPSQKNLPHPIVWLPPDSQVQGMGKNEVRHDASRDVKEHENGYIIKQQPPLWKEWFPFDLNNVASSNQMGDGDENSHQDDGKRNVQFPLFWMPYKPGDTGRENQKVKDISAKSSLESEKNDGGGQNFHVNKESKGEQSAPRVKDIPVMEAEQEFGKESFLNQKREGDTSARERSDNGEKKIDKVEKVSSVEGSMKKSSPPKSSKLPPVCLRIDPLPRKKSAHAKSRSPSPPGDKQKLEDKSNEAVEVRSSDNKQVNEGSDKKTMAAVDGNPSPKKSINVNVETPGNLPAKSQDDVLTKHSEEKVEEGMVKKTDEADVTVDGQSKNVVSAGEEKEALLMVEEMKADAEKKCSKREISEEESAVIIQAAYRGFDVRRWEPIEKLKEIARVREQIADVKCLIQQMELSSDIQGLAKQKTNIAETIMSLLLRLDRIQGLHPSIREVRKSVVRELVSLQEQLDATMKNENLSGQESAMRHDKEDVSSTGGGTEISEANLLDEKAEAAESSVDEQGPTTKDEDEKSSDVLEDNETSIPKEDHETIIPRGSELFLSVQDDSSAVATDLAPTDGHDSLQCELPELPKEVCDNLCDAEGTTHSAIEDSSKADQYEQQEEALVGLPMVQESRCEILSDEENHQTMESCEVSDLPFNGGQLEAEESGQGGSFTNSKPNESADQHPENFPAGKIEPPKAPDERDIGVCCTGNVSTNDDPHENSGSTGSVMEEFPREKETFSQLLPANIQEICLINEHANSCDAVDMVRVESAAAATSDDGTNICKVEQSAADINSSGGVSRMGELSQQGQVCNTEKPSPKGEIAEQELEDAAEHEENNAVEVPPADDDMKERNRKLMEENERLREMMEKIIKAGHEQLTAISSLSGRVKDLEKKISRKKKLKVKQRSSCLTKYDGSCGERTAGVEV